MCLAIRRLGIEMPVPQQCSSSADRTAIPVAIAAPGRQARGERSCGPREPAPHLTSLTSTPAAFFFQAESTVRAARSSSLARARQA